MSSEDVRKSVKDYIWNNFMFGRLSDDLKDADSLLAKGVLDSTGVLEMMGYLEEHFGVHIEDEEVIPENLGSIDNIVTFLHRKLDIQAEV